MFSVVNLNALGPLLAILSQLYSVGECLDPKTGCYSDPVESETTRSHPAMEGGSQGCPIYADWQGAGSTCQHVPWPLILPGL